MDALSFAAGLATGIKNSGGGQTVTDPDYQLWQDMPDPADDQTVFIVRMAAPATVTIAVYSKWDGISAVNAEFTVDWGDESTETFPLTWSNGANRIRHVYSMAGTYTIVCTTSNTDIIPAWYSESDTMLMIKYGENIHLESCWSYSPLYFCSRMKYIKIPASTDFSVMERFFDGCYALRKIVYAGKPITEIYNNMFYACYCLDFSDWDFSQVTAVGDSAFTRDERLEVINLPLCTSIGNSAFSGCSNLLKITVADNCTIGSKAFEYCYSLFPVPA